MEIVNHKTFEDVKGSLTPLEFFNLPFIPKRVFVVNGVPPHTTRGNHSHFKTKQYIFCSSGEVEVFLNDGYKEEKLLLKKNDAVLVPEMIWDSQKFLTHDSEIVVFCSTPYDIKDYIFDFDNFKKLKQNEKKSSNNWNKWTRWVLSFRIFTR